MSGACVTVSPETLYSIMTVAVVVGRLPVGCSAIMSGLYNVTVMMLMSSLNG